MYLGVDVLITLLQNIMAYEVIILYHLHMPFLLSFFCIWALLPLIVYFLALFFESLVCNHSLRIAGLSVLTSIIQLGGYGIGFLSAFIKKVVFRQTGDLNADLERLYKKK